MAIEITSKIDGSIETVSGAVITVSEDSIIRIPYGPEDVASIQSQGGALIVRLNSGEIIRIENFHSTDSDLVLQDSDGELFHAQISDDLAEIDYSQIGSVDQLVGGSGEGSPLLPILGVLAGGAAAAGIAASGSGSDDNIDDS
ncbi:BapA/Bap/LapF family prefix-like domain-containing protein, partial [Limoniibacter endophyticus]